MWTHHAYRWADQAAWLAALAAEGWADGAPPDVALVASGTLYAPQTDLEAEPAALPGWHVAAAFRDRAPPAGWAALEITPPPQMPMLGWNSPGSRVLTVLQFRDRLTAEEEIAITAAGMASPAVRVWLDRLAGAQEVNLDDPRTVAGLNWMATVGLLAPGRVTEILV